MATQSITVVRVYVREGEHQLQKIVRFLQGEQVLGATVLRGITGFGPNGILRTDSLIDLSLDLPLIEEFYGDSIQMEIEMDKLSQQLHMPHIIIGSAVSHASDAS
jgi:PII-like signaling protein